MTMIETMARAAHEFFRPIYKLPPFDDLPADAKSTAFQQAKAVLTGMKASSPAIERVSTSAVSYTNDDIWRMFIDACLAEKLV